MKPLTKKNPRIIFWTLVSIFLLYTIAGFFIVPMIIKSEAVDYIKEEFQRSAEIKSVSFNPFTFSLSVEEFKLYEKEKSDVFISFKKFFVDIRLLPLISKEIYFQEITLTEPDGNIIRFNEEEFNFAGLSQERNLLLRGAFFATKQPLVCGKIASSCTERRSRNDI